MIVSGLLAVVSMATYSGIAAGVKIWKRVEASVKELDLALGWKKVRKDLVGAIPFRPIGFHGNDHGLAFPGLVAVKGVDGQPHNEVGRVRYVFDEINHQLCREDAAYSGTFQKTAASCRPVITSVETISFEYYGLSGDTGSAGGWGKAWDSEKPPMAVRMKIALEKTGGTVGVAQHYTATFPQ